MLKQVKDLLLKIPLYSPQKVEHDDHARLFRLKFFKGNFDCYCADCGAKSTFKGISEGLSVKGYKVPDFNNFKTRFLTDYDVIKNQLLEQIYVVEAECTAKSSHRKAAFVFKVATNYIEKIGQYPAPDVLAENTTESEEEAEELPFESSHELFRMLDTAVEQMGLSSFMYVEPTVRQEIEDSLASLADFFFHQNHPNIDNWNQEAYDVADNAAKVQLLKQHFGSFEAEQKALLEVFKQGIYPLSDKACKDSLPLTEIGLNLLLKPSHEETELSPPLTTLDEEEVANHAIEATDLPTEIIESAAEDSQDNVGEDDDLDLDLDEDSKDAAAIDNQEEEEEDDDFDFDLDEDSKDDAAIDNQEEEEEDDDFDFDLDEDSKDDAAIDNQEEEEEDDDFDFDLDEDSKDDAAIDNQEEEEEEDDDEEDDFDFDLDEDSKDDAAIDNQEEEEEEDDDDDEEDDFDFDDDDFDF